MLHVFSEQDHQRAPNRLQILQSSWNKKLALTRLLCLSRDPISASKWQHAGASLEVQVPGSHVLRKTEGD